MCIPERRHLRIEIRHFPESAPLVLKTKWRQRAIVCATFRKARAEQTRVCQQIRGHERAVTVATYSDAIAIGDAHVYHFVDRGFGAGH